MAGQQNGAVLPQLPTPNQWENEVVHRPDLMPCPFCGLAPSYALFKHPTWAHKHQIVCANAECNAICATRQMKSFEEAVFVWSLRPVITLVTEPPVEVAILDDNDFHQA